MTTKLKPAPNGQKPARERKVLPQRWHRDADIVLESGQPPLLLLVGEPGSGKTTYAHDVARRMTGKAPVVVSGSPETEQSHLFGRWTLTGDGTRFIDGPLPISLKSGRYLVIEEFSQVPLECRASLLPCRDQTEIANPFTNEVLSISPEWRLIATSNSESLTCRKNAGIARVLYSGFQIIETDELRDDDVVSFLRNDFPDATVTRMKRVLALWNEYRELTHSGSSGKAHLNYRAASHLLTLLEHGMAEHRAIEIALIGKFLPSDPELHSVAKLRNSVSSNDAAPTASENDF
jgi:cobaltochelatase CobS